MIVIEKSGVLAQNGCIQAKAVVFGQKWLNSGKRGYIRAKVVFLGKVVVFGKKCCIRAKLLDLSKSGCIRVKLFYSGKSGSIWAKWVVLRQEGLYSGKT